MRVIQFSFEILLCNFCAFWPPLRKIFAIFHYTESRQKVNRRKNAPFYIPVHNLNWILTILKKKTSFVKSRLIGSFLKNCVFLTISRIVFLGAGILEGIPFRFETVAKIHKQRQNKKAKFP